MLRVALWSVLLAAITYTSTDPDLWGNVRFGLDILRHGSIPHTDPYSFTSDRTWVNHEWLSEVCIGYAYQAGGALGLILLKLACIGGMLLLLLATLRREGIHSSIVGDAAAASAVILTFDQTRYVRPQLFSIVCFAVLLTCLTAARRGSHRWLLLLPPLFAVWANLHGGWLVGGGVFALWTIAAVVAGDRLHAMWSAAAGAASLAATLLTPYGFGLWTFLSGTVGLDRADIVEWQPIYVLGWDSCVRWGCTAALAVAGVVFGNRAERQSERIACLVALAAASLMVARLEAFFAVGAILLVGPGIGFAYVTALVRRAGAARSRTRGLEAVAFCVSAVAVVLTTTNLMRLPIDPRWTPEPGAVVFLNAQPPQARVLVWFDWGGYALWHLAPRMRISMDGRRETVYSTTLQDRHLRFYFDIPGGASLPRDLAADYVWIPRTLPAVHRLEAEGWQRVYEGEQSVIFERAALSRPTTPIKLAEVAQTRFFPGP
jgi:hypothetical protein